MSAARHVRHVSASGSAGARGRAAFALLALVAVVAVAISALAVPAQAAVTATYYADGLSPNARLNDITLGPDANLWFTDPGSNAVGRITPRGELTEFSEGLSTRPDVVPFSSPHAITAGPDGNLWFTEPGRNLIGRITPEGDITEYSRGISPDAHPTGITAGGDGNLWFTEPGVGTTPLQPGRGMVGRITPQGEVTEFPQAVGASGEITAGADGNLWYIAQGGIGRITPQGDATLFRLHEDAVPYLFGLTTGPDGNLWFTEGIGIFSVSRKIGRLTPQAVLTEFPGGGFGDITAGPDGNLWFTENDVGLIGRVTPEGQLSQFCHGIGSGAAPGAITAGPDGNVWFTEGNWDTHVSRIGRVEIRASDAVERAPTSYIVYPSPDLRARPRYVLGRACDDQAVTRLDISVTRLAPRRNRPICLALSRRGRWLTYKAVRRQCKPRFLLRARTKTSWRLRLPHRLGTGRYTISSRATDSTGQRETVFSAERGNVRTLTVRVPK